MGLRRELICRCFGSPAAFLMFVTNAFFLASWDPQTPLKAALLSGLTNLLLDLLLVNVFGWGIAGAAIATVAAQVCPSPLDVHCPARRKGKGEGGGATGRGWPNRKYCAYIHFPQSVSLENSMLWVHLFWKEYVLLCMTEIREFSEHEMK